MKWYPEQFPVTPKPELTIDERVMNYMDKKIEYKSGEYHQIIRVTKVDVYRGTVEGFSLFDIEHDWKILE